MREKLSAGFCDKTTKLGRHADGGNLYLFVQVARTAKGEINTTTDGEPVLKKSWVFRFRDPITGKQQDMGLGKFGRLDVTLAKARIKAANCRDQLRENLNPKAERDREKEERKLAAAKRLTFKQCATRYIDAHKAGWRNAKHAAQWQSTLDTYAAPIMDLAVTDIDTGLVLKCLEPEWASKTETMTRVRQRIEAVLDWATVRSYRKGDNPARWKGHLDKILPKPTKLKVVKHRAALPYPEIGVFIAELRAVDTTAAQALELQILTATRPGEVVGATWQEIDLEARLWTIDGSRMKAGKAHEIPLSDRAVELMRKLPRIAGSDYLFPGQKKGTHLSTAATMKALKQIRTGITAHGFRSTFRDWAAEQTSFQRDTIEKSLAHRLKDKAEASYYRCTVLPKRRKLMDAWSQYCDTVRTGIDNVTTIGLKTA